MTSKTHTGAGHHFDAILDMAKKMPIDELFGSIRWTQQQIANHKTALQAFEDSAGILGDDYDATRTRLRKLRIVEKELLSIYCNRNGVTVDLGDEAEIAFADSIEAARKESN